MAGLRRIELFFRRIRITGPGKKACALSLRRDTVAAIGTEFDASEPRRSTAEFAVRFNYRSLPRHSSCQDWHRRVTMETVASAELPRWISIPAPLRWEMLSRSYGMHPHRSAHDPGDTSAREPLLHALPGHGRLHTSFSHINGYKKRRALQTDVHPLRCEVRRVSWPASLLRSIAPSRPLINRRISCS